jgi:hypothetical protein
VEQGQIEAVGSALEGVEYVGRNHPLVEGMAFHLLADALKNGQDPVAARCELTVTDAVEKQTTLVLLWLRHLLKGFTGSPDDPLWLEPEMAGDFLQRAEPVEPLSV